MLQYLEMRNYQSCNVSSLVLVSRRRKNYQKNVQLNPKERISATNIRCTEAQLSHRRFFFLKDTWIRNNIRHNIFEVLSPHIYWSPVGWFRSGFLLYNNNNRIWWHYKRFVILKKLKMNERKNMKQIRTTKLRMSKGQLRSILFFCMENSSIERTHQLSW